MPETRLQDWSKKLRIMWRHPANRGRRLRTAVRALAVQAWMKTAAGHYDVALAGGLKARVYPNDISMKLLFFNGLHEYDEMLFVLRYLRPGDHYVDVGANIGAHCLLAAARIGNGCIDAFEPTPRTRARLEENLRLNGLENVRVHGFAVGAATAPIKLLPDRGAANRAWVEDDGDVPAIEVPSCRLDDVLPDRVYALGKIDIEGFEPLAFRGATRSLAAANPPVWIMEMKAPLLARYGFDAADFANELRQFGFDLGSYDADRNLLEFSHRPWERHENVIAVAHSARPAVLARLGAPADR